MKILSNKCRFLGAFLFVVVTTITFPVVAAENEPGRGSLTVTEAHAALQANGTILEIIRDTLEMLPPGGRMDADARKAAQANLREGGIIHAESSCSDQPANVMGFVILPWPETLRIVSVGYRERLEIDGVVIRLVEFSTPDAVFESYLFVVGNERCEVSAIIQPQALEIPSELPLIDVLTKHLRSGRIAEVEAELDSLPGFDEKDKFGDTLLTEAAGANADALVAEFLDRGANIEQKDRSGATALMAAANAGHGSTVELILQRGADPNTRDNIGYTPMIRAASGDHVEVMILLKKHGATLQSRTYEEYFGGGSTALHRAAILCQRSAVRWLLENGVDANAEDAYGATPLMGVASRDCIEVARLLIDHGADVNARSQTGTALRWAAAFGTMEMIELLIESGAKVRKSDIRAAREQGRTEVVSLLKKRRTGN
jgi:ankyrin repeat protein